MSDVFSFALLGLGAAGVYTLLAQGIVVIYRGSGILNFALGAYAMLASYVFVELRKDAGLSLVPSLLIAVPVVAVLGGLTFQIVMRPLRNAAPVTRAIATLGVLISFNAVATLRWGAAPIAYVDKILPSGRVEIFGTTVTIDRLYLIGIAILLTLVLWFVYSRTLFGLATTASADNPLAATTFGWSPNLIATINWTLGCGLAGLAGILFLPVFVGLEVTRLTLVIIYALAVALIGGFKSFPRVLVGGLAVGIAESIASRYLNGSITGASATVPLLIIVAYLVFRGRSIPDRSTILERLPRLGTGRTQPWVVLGLTVVTAALVFGFFSTSWNAAISASLVTAVVMLSLVVLTGYSGQLSLGQFALAGFGAWVAARLVHDLNFPFELAAVIGVIGTIPLGLLFALPALRTRGINLAVVTLALGVAVQNILFNNVALTGGADGIEVGPQSILGISIDTVTEPARYTVLALVIFVLCALAVTNLRRGRAGRRLIAVRTNERAAVSLGIDLVGAKLYAFGLSSAIAAVGGILYAFRSSIVLLGDFNALQSILLVAFVVIGGLGFVVGPLFGSLLVAGGVGMIIGDNIVSGLGFDVNETVQYLALVGGLSVIVILIQSADGLAYANARFAHIIGGLFRRHVLRRPVSAHEPVQVAATDLFASDGVAPTQQNRPATLTVSGLRVRFGGVVAVDDVSFQVRPGEVVGLIGPNGAGKTTVIDAITGFVKPSSGTFSIEDTQLEGLLAYKRARAGVSRSFQSLELFEDVTVRDNLLAAADDRDLKAYVTNLVRPGATHLPPAAQAAVEAFGLTDVLDRMPTELPYGRRRLVAIARTVATSPSVLLLDEPAAGLDEDESAELALLVRRIADEWGISVLLVEHDMAFVMGICDRVVVLEFGKKIAEGTTSQVRNDPAVIAAYLGKGPDDEPAPGPASCSSGRDSEGVSA